MLKFSKILIFVCLCLTFSQVAFADASALDKLRSFLAPLVYKQDAGEEPVQTVERISVLIVPGHDETSVGAQYGKIKEADMNLSLGTAIYELLKSDGRFDVKITRDKDGYTEEFADYFDANRGAISDFIKSSKKKLKQSITNGEFIDKTTVPHGSADEVMALRLYGFNKWANEHNTDVVLHVHFNDYTRKSKWTMGTRKGFAVYMPDRQFPNHEVSNELAVSVFNELSTKYKTSNYYSELGGLIADQKLIAIGSYATLSRDVRSVLVEYGYIYEFGNSKVRSQAYKTMSRLTVCGIKNVFIK